MKKLLLPVVSFMLLEVFKTCLDYHLLFIQQMLTKPLPTLCGSVVSDTLRSSANELRLEFEHSHMFQYELTILVKISVFLFLKKGDNNNTNLMRLL